VTAVTHIRLGFSSKRTFLFASETAHFSRPIIFQHICCCVKPLVIPCIRDATILHAIHGSVYVTVTVLLWLPFLGSDADVQLSICLLPETLSCNVWIFRLCLVKQQCVESLLFHPYTHLTCPPPSQWPKSCQCHLAHQWRLTREGMGTRVCLRGHT